MQFGAVWKNKEAQARAPVSEGDSRHQLSGSREGESNSTNTPSMAPCTWQAFNMRFLHLSLIWGCLSHCTINSPKAGVILLLFENLFGRCSKLFMNRMAFLSPLKQLRAEGTSELGLYVHLFVHSLSKGLLRVYLI